MVKKNVQYYDEDTGELIEHKESSITDISVRFKVGSGNGNVASRFTKVFQVEDPNFEVASYYRYFFKCLLHLEMFTNRIVFFTKDKSEPNKPLDELDFLKLFDTSLKTVRNFFGYCKENDIIAKISKNDDLYGYIVNPIYALNGNRISSMLYTMFRNNDLDKHIPTQDLLKLQEYLKMQPYIEENIFLKN